MLTFATLATAPSPGPEPAGVAPAAGDSSAYDRAHAEAATTPATRMNLDFTTASFEHNQRFRVTSSAFDFLERSEEGGKVSDGGAAGEGVLPGSGGPDEASLYSARLGARTWTRRPFDSPADPWSTSGFLPPSRISPILARGE